MANVKQIVKNALELKNASPAILASIDTILQRSIIRLQSEDLLPPRTLEFTSLDRKQEKRVDDELIYNYYNLPDDFRRLDRFRPYRHTVYRWQGDEHQLYQRIATDDLSDEQTDKIQREYTIVNTNQRDDIKSEKILIAYPFPDDDEVIQIKYDVNGKGLDFDWIDEDYWEAIIYDIEEMVGLRSAQDPETERRIGDAVERHKETAKRGDTDRTVNGTFFGKRTRNLIDNNNNINNV